MLSTRRPAPCGTGPRNGSGHSVSIYLFLYIVRCALTRFVTRILTNLINVLLLFSHIHISVIYTVKKVSGFPVPRRDVTYQTLPGREKLNYSSPGGVWWVTSRLGTGKPITFFYSVWTPFKGNPERTACRKNAFKTAFCKIEFILHTCLDP